ncbi:MAG TPA: hypothetical protein VGP06_05805 [Janthinobacterium sp.]|nr:hypothetical protein [Janthinobacterium sp.]
MNDISSLRCNRNSTIRLSTGIAGLDDILCGGLTAQRGYLVDGSPWIRMRNNPSSIHPRWSRHQSGRLRALARRRPRRRHQHADRRPFPHRQDVRSLLHHALQKQAARARGAGMAN